MNVKTQPFSEEMDRLFKNFDAQKFSQGYWAQDEFIFIPPFLPEPLLSALMEEANFLQAGVNRNHIPKHKKGGSVSAFTLAQEAPMLHAFYLSDEFRKFVERLVGKNLQLCPPKDPHSHALYYYTEAGDHIGCHYDTSYYRGARYTILVGLIQQSSSRLLARLHTRQSEKKPVDLSLDTVPGSMVIFNGDKVYHAVSPSKEGERRVVFTMEYVTNQGMRAAQRIFSNLKDAFGYFGVKSLFQSWRKSI
ncbi:MAG: 2OG-Fe(II) oxygenase [Chlamydiae bacterium]|nr:2OG-Fe(II) oxygenase [Chlamydiota bacterium]MBI3267128.1 2OG-Fe(II) oxygenase [Chlamydiota bacterium]